MCFRCRRRRSAWNEYRVCFFFRLRFRPASVEPPEAIKKEFDEYANDGGMMGVHELAEFLAKVQGEPAGTSLEAAQAIIDGVREVNPLRVFQKKKDLSLDSFYRFLFSDDNAAHPPLGVYQDMTAPLAHYFIFTGHNSYLTGNQLSSICSDEPIIQALQNGVRVIELDLWPNKTHTAIDVVHGGTLTHPVELIKCLTSIKKFAFKTSEYPVIITFEDHLDAGLQAIVAQMLIEIFGDMLFTSDSKSLQKFPSPEELKMRIIISTKPPKVYLESSSKVPKEEEEEQKGDQVKPWSGELSDHEDKPSDIQRQVTEHDDEEEDQIVAPEYKNLIGITAKKLKGDLGAALKIDPFSVSRLSLSELALEKATLSHATELVRFTQTNLLRIYPKGTRVTSSNYKPLLAWTHGAQMVALNMQGHGKELWLMQGMFRANGGCGYVKKPDMLLKNDDPNNVFDPRAALVVKKILKVRVYTGDGWRFDFDKHYFDSYSPPDFYTRVGIAGVGVDTAKMKETHAIEDDWTPVWDEEFEFQLRVPELALLRVEVYEHDMSDPDDFAGQTCLPVWELRTGIRSVRLCDHEGKTLPSVKLLMRFEIVDVV
ncbi:phosphoinositide phospholipase C 2-like isoform X2 [Zingiber officinale]|uniref:phosphoinositide phospholipase C 2-like isoform X2 n=2 Tax=Zingiber officinale TaxID=94328 RepID=UPI001C4D8BA1|nr:phosphoinositide phospholipase C 2-like isoform X2 [Zingiber officinale]